MGAISSVSGTDRNFSLVEGVETGFVYRVVPKRTGESRLEHRVRFSSFCDGTSCAERYVVQLVPSTRHMIREYPFSHMRLSRSACYSLPFHYFLHLTPTPSLPLPSLLLKPMKPTPPSHQSAFHPFHRFKPPRPHLLPSPS